MSEQRPIKYPYQTLGGQLKVMREKHKESLAEVSGAVEVDLDAMREFEQGVARPSEDILLLLISHFDVKEDEAVKLWELAGYTRTKKEAKDHTMPHDDNKNQQLLMVMQMDTRVIYTDTVQVSVNNYGVVMNFMQNAGQNSQPTAIARVGMSKEHAESVIDLLQRSLAQAEQVNQPKSLPAPKTNRRNSPKQDKSSK